MVRYKPRYNPPLITSLVCKITDVNFFRLTEHSDLQTAEVFFSEAARRSVSEQFRLLALSSASLIQCIPSHHTVPSAMPSDFRTKLYHILMLHFIILGSADDFAQCEAPCYIMLPHPDQDQTLPHQPVLKQPQSMVTSQGYN
jgi:hypothetical protein